MSNSNSTTPIPTPTTTTTTTTTTTPSVIPTSFSPDPSSALTINYSNDQTAPGGYFLQNLSSLGLGYAIAIALGFLVLLSTLLLASCVCCRARARNRNNQSHQHHQSDHVSHSNNGIILPRILFVAEDYDDNGARADEENIVMGLDQMVINSYPKFCYCKNEKDFNSSNNDSVCSICLCDYRDGEMLRMMPDCRHYFHLICIGAWLRLNPSCPVCRNSPLPTPLSTPLSELVPLSHYPGGNRTR